jgi:hypothetical protein
MRVLVRLSVPALLVVLALTLTTSGPAGAVVPPKDCGRMSDGGQRYQVKVDGISCKAGRRYASRYLDRESSPAGYRCRDYPSRRGRVDFYCNAGRKIFFAIRR